LATFDGEALVPLPTLAFLGVFALGIFEGEELEAVVSTLEDVAPNFFLI
jgi:hypothetical protein